MGYYIRILGTSLADVPVRELRERARPALIEADESAGEAWEQLVLKHEAGPEIAVIEKNLVLKGELGAEGYKNSGMKFRFTGPTQPRSGSRTTCPP